MSSVPPCDIASSSLSLGTPVQLPIWANIRYNLTLDQQVACYSREVSVVCPASKKITFTKRGEKNFKN